MEAHELALSKLLSHTLPYLTGLQWRKRLQERWLVIFWMSLDTALATAEKEEPGPVKSPSKLKLFTCQCLPSRVTKYRIPYCTLNSYIGEGISASADCMLALLLHPVGEVKGILLIGEN